MDMWAVKLVHLHQLVLGVQFYVSSSCTFLGKLGTYLVDHWQPFLRLQNGGKWRKGQPRFDLSTCFALRAVEFWRLSINKTHLHISITTYNGGNSIKGVHQHRLASICKASSHVHNMLTNVVPHWIMVISPPSMVHQACCTEMPRATATPFHHVRLTYEVRMEWHTFERDAELSPLFEIPLI